MLSMGTNSKIVFLEITKEIQQHQQEKRPTHLLTTVVAVQEHIEVQAELDLQNPV